MSEAPSSDPETQPRRRLAAVWFIDIAGYTAMAWRDESTALAIVQLFQQMVRTIVADHGGRLVKFIGDEALAEFISADSAVHSALDIVSDFGRATRDRGTPADVRAGVHVGDLFTAGDGDIYGSGVNLTSRIQDAAEPGEVVISEDVWRLIHPQSAYGFASLGERRLKGFPAPVGLYRVRPRGVEPDPAARPSRADALSLVVRPLEDATGGRLEYLALGLTEEIVGALGRVDGLRVTVAPPGSASAIRGGTVEDGSPDSDAVLTGRLRGEEDRVGVDIELTRTGTGISLWRASHELERAEVPSFHREVVRSVVEALEVRRADGAVLDPPEGRYRPDPEAYDLYLRGRHHWNRHSREDLDRSVACFERALEIDPDYALAYAGLADAWLTLGALFLRPREAYPKAKAAATRALELDEHLAEAHAALAEARLRFDWDRVAAERGFQRALELRPDYGEAQRMYANFLRDVGRVEEAIVVARRAEVLDPVSLPIRAAVAGVLYYARRYAECVEEVDRILEASPWFFQPVFYRALALERMGRYDEAVATFQRLGRLSGLPSTLAGEAYVQATMGREVEALNLLARLEEDSRARYVPAYFFASVHAALGDLDAAFEWFGRAIEERSSWMVSIAAEPRFDSIREDPRFADLLQAMGLADAEVEVRGNLTAELTPTIGRLREAAELERLLWSGNRLVTLTGPPGTGKTRLALHVAGRSRARYPDGVWLAELNPFRDPDRVMPEIARTLGVGERPGEDLVSTIAGFLESRRLLLVLDGMEGVLPSAHLISRLLGHAPGCQILATSRVPLRLRGEREYLVAPLGIPVDASPDRASESPAVHLFVDRARSVRPGFELDSRNTADVAEICRRLDGLPLAIELAAVRVNLVNPAEMLHWMDDRMGFLTVGPRDLPDHQKTLRVAFDWSYDLLLDDQRSLLRSLSVFAGGFDLDAIVAVCGHPEGSIAVLEALSVLVDNSLLRRIETPGGGVRYTMLETVREYGAL
ncbi:MAG TPA: adenylate/guanylate cyclase domain-containing protein, partial [Gemmatimonadota bacterium]|nr:adenylate/guanylate cyclase domain-containing protein [Gemmatimonadota bacterium]